MIDAEASSLMREIFNMMTTEQKNSVPPDVARRIALFMTKNGYRLVFNRWYLQEETSEIDILPALKDGEDVKKLGAVFNVTLIQG